MEDTTTDAATQDTGVVTDTTQPDEQPAEAVETPTTEPTELEEATEGEPASADTSDDDLSDYWAKKGIDITTPEGQAKAAKSYREAEKAMHSKSAEASQLKKAATDLPVNGEDDRIARLEIKSEIRDWQIENGIKPGDPKDIKMGNFLEANPAKKLALQYGVLSLDEIYTLSGADKIGQPDPNALKSQGKEEALRQLANKQQAVSPKGSASTQTSDIKTLEERLADVKF